MNVLFFMFCLSLLCGVACAVPIIPGITIYAHDILIVIWLAFSVKKIVRNYRTVHLSLYAFICTMVFSLLANAWKFDPGQLIAGSMYVVRWILYALFFVLLRQSRISSRFLLRSLYLVGTSFSLLGLCQFVLYPDLRNLWYAGWDPHYYRVFSTLLDPNYLGLFIVLTIFLGLSLSSGKTYMIWFFQIVNIVALYLTYSRSSYVSFAIGIVTIILMQRRILLGRMLIVFIFAVFLLPTPGGDTLRLTRMDSTIARLENWQMGWNLFTSAPLLGHGFNLLRYSSNTNDLPDGPVSHARSGLDNSFLFLLATTGVIGFVSYLWFFWNLTPKTSVFIGAFIASITHAMFINSLFFPWIMLWWWIAAAAQGKQITSHT